MIASAGSARAFMDYDRHRRAAGKMRSEVVRNALSMGVSAITPSGRALRTLGLAFLIATGAFWGIMLQDPPKMIAADPGVAAQTISPLTMNIPVELPSGAYGAH